jgi:hypothetical protein
VAVMKQFLSCLATVCVLVAVRLVLPWPAFAVTAGCPPTGPHTFTIAEAFDSTGVETVLCLLPVADAPTKDLNFDLKESTGSVSDYLDVFSQTAEIPGLVRLGSDTGQGLTSRSFATDVTEEGSEGSDSATIGPGLMGVNTTLIAHSDVLPEPSTIALMVTGLGSFALGYLRQRRGHKKQPAGYSNSFLS